MPKLSRAKCYYTYRDSLQTIKVSEVIRVIERLPVSYFKRIRLDALSRLVHHLLIYSHETLDKTVFGFSPTLFKRFVDVFISSTRSEYENRLKIARDAKLLLAGFMRHYVDVSLNQNENLKKFALQTRASETSFSNHAHDFSGVKTVQEICSLDMPFHILQGNILYVDRDLFKRAFKSFLDTLRSFFVCTPFLVVGLTSAVYVKYSVTGACFVLRENGSNTCHVETDFLENLRPSTDDGLSSTKICLDPDSCRAVVLKPRPDEGWWFYIQFNNIPLHSLSTYAASYVALEIELRPNNIFTNRSRPAQKFEFRVGIPYSQLFNHDIDEFCTLLFDPLPLAARVLLYAFIYVVTLSLAEERRRRAHIPLSEAEIVDRLKGTHWGRVTEAVLLFKEHCYKML